MLDQSFSAENFRNIFQIENRKGNLKKEMFPAKYIDLIKDIKSLKAEINEKSRERKDGIITKEEYQSIKDENNCKIKECKKKKDDILYDQVKRISTNVNNDSFRFTINIEERKGKPVYQLGDSLEVFYAIKQLQYNIRKTFKVKQADRYSILKQIKLLLSDNFPKYIIRTDIKSFYESIPQVELLEKVEQNTLLNYQSKKFIAEIIEEYEAKKNLREFEVKKGVPRGIGISAYLVELYMRDIDSKIKSLEHVTFYARYVDDIFIIITPNTKSSSTNYFEEVNKIITSARLELKPVTDPKTQLVDMLNKVDGFNSSINYLGYRFNTLGIKAKEDFIDYRLSVNLSENKIDKYKSRIKLSFDTYNNESKYDERKARKILFDCLRMLTGNTNLINSKKGVKIGVYFSNSLLDKEKNGLKDLKSLDDFLTKMVHSNLVPYSELPINIEKLKSQIKQSFSFQKGFEDKRFHKFKIKEMNILKRIWTDETI
ncbi:MAG: antiviral reverse transcriptase Drt3a [Bacteroidales bacterium]|nr:RNA-directed DNA polymerase [Bacteroidales bacterium]